MTIAAFVIAALSFLLALYVAFAERTLRIHQTDLQDRQAALQETNADLQARMVKIEETRDQRHEDATKRADVTIRHSRIEERFIIENRGPARAPSPCSRRTAPRHL